MRDISRRGAIAVAAGLPVAMLGRPGIAGAAPSPATFTLLLVNDIYKMGEVKGRGGFPRLAAIVEAERARGVPTLFCHAGDCFSPSLLSGFDRGEHIVALTNLIPPDVFVPGNHEFDFGPEVFRQRMREARFPFFGANMRGPDGRLPDGMAPSRIFAFGPVKVGVVGLVMEEVPQLSHPGDIAFEPVLPTLEREAKALRAGGADLVVAVAHTDREMDERIVRSRLVDVLLTGHDHDLAIGFDGRTVMVESSEEAHFVTAIDIAATVTGEGPGRTVTWSPSFRVHDSSQVTPHPDVARVVAAYEEGLSKVLDVELGTTLTPLDSRTAAIRSGEAAIANFVTDVMRVSTEAEAALMNAGGIRANVVYPAGSRLTRRDVLSELPFGNTTVLVEIAGRDILAMLEHGLSQVNEPAGRFPQLSGMRVRFSPREPAGRRVRALEIAGAPVELDRRYRLASNDFMLAGGDGYTAMANGHVLIGKTDGRLVANEVMAAIKDRGTIAPVVEGRLVAVD